MKEKLLRQVIQLFLRINDEPSDQQFHALAEALGVDKETLESISYQMLAEIENNSVYANEVDELSDAQEVLDGEYDSNTTQTNDLLLNDGVPAGEDDTLMIQDSTLSDGIGEDDNGPGIADKEALYNDGLTLVKLNAKVRLVSI